ncbi:galactose mutarotase-like domain-containing protein [Obelidium mucronatum]|nr:galactose mutarotase-like domain-containing protein [Obelidium mucronatum]
MLGNNSQRLTTNLNTLQKHRDITLARFDKFVQRGQFEDVNLNTCLWKKRNSEAVSLLVYAVPDLKRISFQEAIKGDYKPTSVGSWFGPTLATFWFKVSIVIPPSFADEEVLFEFDASNEAMIWTSDGRPVTGLTGGGEDDRHADYVLTNKAKPGEKFEFYVEMACNFRGGIAGDRDPRPDMNRNWKLETADITVRNKVGSSLFLYFKTLIQLVKETPEEWQINADALYHADSIINAFRLNNESALQEAHDLAIKFFAERKKEGRALHEINAVGNCHIDTAWLWPFDETKRKAGRSWARQIMFMKSNPKFTFTASQAQQFAWVEELYPTLFDEMKEFTRKGQFHPIGGTWVEMDCNMPSGEALCRQFLHGQRYFESRFGKRCTVFWLPDTFGYSAQLPQISNSAGMKYFFTQKIGWNNINRFPHTTFKWAGLDNSEVLTHFTPADTYVGQCNVGELVKSVHNNKDKAYSNKSIYLYGNGDGGGGPLAHMIDRLEILSSVEGLPATVKNCDPAEFYKELEASSRDLNRWKGELYFELHRGTYTSHGLIKKYNRKSEILLREVEFLSTLALANPHGGTNNFSYPQAELDRLWKLVLLNQFHDVLPGSSIKLVYDDAIRFYEDVEKTGTKLKEEALKALMGSMAAAKGRGTSQAVAVINTTSWPLTDVVEVDMAQLTAGTELYGASTWQQFSKGGQALVYVDEINTGSVKTFALGNKPAGFVPVTVKQVLVPYSHTNADGFVTVESETKIFVIENNFVRVKIDQNGRLISLFDREADHESIAPDQLGNVFKIFEDIPTAWDAWDVEVYHLEKGWDAGVGVAVVEEAGPLRVVLNVKHPLSSTSTLEQRIIITAADAKIDFETKVDWHENRVILKVEFPLNINSDYATYETQFGYIQRPTHYNTSWDLARFEVCGHRYADLSEYGFGVALFNDCKYGYSTKGGVMRMSLLRSPKGPDDTTDMEVHTFRYALYPHKGTFLESNVVEKAYQYNERPIVHPTLVNPSALISSEFFTVSHRNFVLDTVKVAEDPRVSGKDGQVDVVLRFYEAYGGRGVARVDTLFNIKEARFCNILEDLQDNVVIEDGGKSLVVPFGPFKVVSVRLLIGKRLRMTLD